MREENMADEHDRGPGEQASEIMANILREVLANEARTDQHAKERRDLLERLRSEEDAAK
jgi:hypothetical protein